VQALAHRSLAALRPHGAALGYRTPTGLLFARIASPHYLAEIALYVCFALLVGTSAAVWACALFVGFNLTHAAGETLRWSRARLPGFPAGRRALVPYVW
jgi:hypothetical protein